MTDRPDDDPDDMTDLLAALRQAVVAAGGNPDAPDPATLNDQESEYARGVIDGWHMALDGLDGQLRAELESACHDLDIVWATGTMQGCVTRVLPVQQPLTDVGEG